jgi:outer membrane protein OmpA-like peptidoglycan-associated protein
MTSSPFRPLILLALGSLVACATPSESKLSLRKVVLYRSGMGYFEHAGRLEDSRLQLRLRAGEIDDVMKTIAVMAKDDGAVVGAVAALKKRGEEGDVDLELRVATNRDVTLSYAVPTPTWRSTHKLVLGDGDSGLLQTWAVVDNATDEDWRDVLLTLATGAPLSFAVDLHTAQFVTRPDATGHLTQPAAIGVVAPATGRSTDRDGDRIPDDVDKCPDEPETYNGFEDEDGCPDKGRVIVRKGKLEILDKLYFEKGKSTLQPTSSTLLDAIAATLNGNLQIVSVEVAGHAGDGEADPGGLAWARAVTVHDALVARDVNGARLVKRGYSTTLPVCTERSEACRSQNRRVDFTILKRAEEAPISRLVPEAPAGPSTPVEATIAELEKSLRPAPTATEEVAGMVRFDIRTPVTIPARASAMVAIQNRRVAGTEIYLYRPDASAPGTGRHPFRAARFQCPPGQELEPGPLAIYARGTFVGDAVLDRLHPGEVSFVPFAVDGATDVTVTTRDESVPFRLVKIERGVLTVEDRRVHRTTYEVAASDSAPARIVVSHPGRAGYRITELPTGSIEAGEGHLVPFSLRAGAKSALVLQEEQPVRREVRPLEGQGVDLDAYLKGSPKVPAQIVAELRRAATIDRALDRSAVDERVVRERLDDSSRRMNELRENLASIEKNATADKLRRELTQRLTQSAHAQEELEKTLATLTTDRDQQRAQLRVVLQDLDLEEMAP